MGQNGSLSTVVMKISLMAFLTQFYFLLGYPASWRTYQPLFLPGPQYCPDTGRTVCTAVDYYPTDQIFHLLTSSRSQVFNLTSLFVDERKGDVEPNLAQLPTPQPHYQDGYGGSQSPPGSRFSPAGYNNWNTPTSDKPSSLGGVQQDRWRQVGQNQNNNRQSVPGTPRGPYMPGVDRQSRAQVFNNQRRTMNVGRNPMVTQRFNYNEHTRPGVQDNYGLYGNRGVTQQNVIDPQQNIPYGNPQRYGTDNFTRFYAQDVQQQDPYQIQPPQTQYSGVKGQNPYTGVTLRPQTTGNWKGSPSYTDKTGTSNPTLPGSLQRDSSRSQTVNRRERRNEDVEVACQVRSTYVPPRAALSDNSEWKYIVNVPERDRRFTQVVRVDICLNPGDPCSSRLSLPFGFESRCRQKYIKKKLLSLNADGQGTSEDNFFIPSCCVCEITRQNQKK
ncbi:protein spaetzle 5 [Trichonephila clavata]|uniref:Protein spaetzle 5 n=1 Tax=Trichonephila clavata TaxID=2740835 RepID=A0A8X6M0H8_TRICU|nr:protein spaetzle 5 [Trichonephila clavata]